MLSERTIQFTAQRSFIEDLLFVHYSNIKVIKASEDAKIILEEITPGGDLKISLKINPNKEQEAPWTASYE